MPAIVSISIYTYHVNQNSPVPRGQGMHRFNDNNEFVGVPPEPTVYCTPLRDVLY